MFTRNYDLICSICSSTFKKSNISVLDNKTKNVNGDTVYSSFAVGYFPFNNFVITNNVGSQNGQTALLVGSNDAPETYDDFKLNLITGLTGISATEFQTGLIENDTIFENTIKVIYTNSNSDTITIKEIGAYYDPVGNTSNYYQFLIYREVLDTPIEVPAGANVVISLTKRVNLYSNQPADYVATASIE